MTIAALGELMDNNKTVLTVDDDSSVRILIRAALASNKSISVIEASDGVAGLEAVRAHRPDLVILDVMMPKQNGIDTLSKLRSDPDISTTPVIMLSGVKDQSKIDVINARQDIDFSPTPFVVENLRSKVNALLFPDA